MTRLFSNLERNGETLKHRPGSLLGAIALVAGTTVGAGILALPAVTLPSGVVPSSTLLIAVWLYALVCALLIAEVNLSVIAKLGRPGVGLLSMVEVTLGKAGASVAGVAYLFLHYALLVAYLAQGGEILGAAIAPILRAHSPFPTYGGTTLFALLFGSILYCGQEQLIERLNNVFVAIVIVSFVGLLGFGVTAIQPGQVFHQDWTALSTAIPVMFVALFYHNVIPVITTQLEGDAPKIRQAILLGSVVPLLMFLAWNAVILGGVSSELFQKAIQGQAVFDPLQVLRQGQAGLWLSVLVSVFSEFAIATSFIGFVYGLLDFFKDGLKLTPDDRSQRLSLYSLVLLPPMGLSALNPNLFFTALDYAGAFSISILGGILPAIMAWRQRYQPSADNVIKPLIPGGKVTLVGAIAVALVVIVEHLLSVIHLS